MVNPLISIIIPVFNRCKLIGETLDSILQQTYTNWECIIVDDGSTDCTERIIQIYEKKDFRIKCFKRPNYHLSGGNGARNYGLTLASGDYIQWFDSDDLMLPCLLEKQLQNLQNSNMAFSICLFDVYNFDFSKITKKSSPQYIAISIYHDYVINKIKANLPSILFYRQNIVKFKLNEHLHKAQEFEFLQRFFKANPKKGIVLNQNLVKVRRHQDSITENQTALGLKSALWVFMETYRQLPDDTTKFIKYKVINRYLKYLYLAFKYNYTKVFYCSLSKMVYFGELKAWLAIFYLGLLYPLVKFKLIAPLHYKRIFNLYK